MRESDAVDEWRGRTRSFKRGPGPVRGPTLQVCDMFCVFTLFNRYIVAQGPCGIPLFSDPFLASLDSRGWSAFKGRDRARRDERGPAIDLLLCFESLLSWAIVNSLLGRGSYVMTCIIVHKLYFVYLFIWWRPKNQSQSEILTKIKDCLSHFFSFTLLLWVLIVLLIAWAIFSTLHEKKYH